MFDCYINFENKQDTEYKKYINNLEYNYLKLLKNILENGDKRQTRNAVTLSTFGYQLKFNLDGQFPILTTKKMYWKEIVEELL